MAVTGWLRRTLLAGVGAGEEPHLVLDAGLEVDGAAPEEAQAAERLDGGADLEVQAVPLVGEEELAAVEVVGVHDVDEGLSGVGEAVEQGLLDLLEVAADEEGRSMDSTEARVYPVSEDRMRRSAEAAVPIAASLASG